MCGVRRENRAPLFHKELTLRRMSHMRNIALYDVSTIRRMINLRSRKSFRFRLLIERQAGRPYLWRHVQFPDGFALFAVFEDLSSRLYLLLSKFERNTRPRPPRSLAISFPGGDSNEQNAAQSLSCFRKIPRCFRIIARRKHVCCSFSIYPRVGTF